MAQKILILGTRTLAEHMADVISEIPGYEVAGFVENLERERCSEPLLGLPVTWVEDIDKLVGAHLAVCALGTTRRSIFVDQVAARGMKFATLVHPTAWVSSKARLGTGSFVNVHSSVATKTVVGNHVIVNRGAVVGHHAQIGDYVTIGPGARIAGLVSIGKHTFIGIGAVILDRVTIGEGCIIGAGSVVTRDLPDAVMVMGVPARIVGTEVERR